MLFNNVDEFLAAGVFFFFSFSVCKLFLFFVLIFIFVVDRSICSSFIPRLFQKHKHCIIVVVVAALARAMPNGKLWTLKPYIRIWPMRRAEYFCVRRIYYFIYSSGLFLSPRLHVITGSFVSNKNFHKNCIALFGHGCVFRSCCFCGPMRVCVDFFPSFFLYFISLLFLFFVTRSLGKMTTLSKPTKWTHHYFFVFTIIASVLPSHLCSFNSISYFHFSTSYITVSRVISSYASMRKTRYIFTN